jgi:hypothetical protein
MIQHRKSFLIALSIPLLIAGCGSDREKGMNKDKGFPRTETPKVEKKKAPETKAPETKAPETKVPDKK